MPLQQQIDVLVRDAEVQRIQQQSRDRWLTAMNLEVERLLERSLFTVATDEPAVVQQSRQQRVAACPGAQAPVAVAPSYNYNQRAAPLSHNCSTPLWCIPPQLQASIKVGERVLLPTDLLGTIVCVSKFNRVVIEDDDGFTHYVHKEKLRPTDINQRLTLLLPLLQREGRRAAINRIAVGNSSAADAVMDTP